jgi:tRNA pseudouridine(55) synthase
MNGILIVDKPTEVTSADVVRSIKRRVRVKVGHLGTLDPFASGLLPLCLGEATKIAQFLNAAGKTYEGTLQLGEATDTADRTGTVTATAEIPLIDRQTLDAAAHFLGSTGAPMYSALKRDGVPLYKLARQGIEVERASRTIQIGSLSLSAAENASDPLRGLVLEGTYAVLAEDIGSFWDRCASQAAAANPLRELRSEPGDRPRTMATRRWGCCSIRDALQASDHLGRCRRRDGGPSRTGLVVGQGDGRHRPREVVLIDGVGDVVAVVERHGSAEAFARVLSGPIFT